LRDNDQRRENPVAPGAIGSALKLVPYALLRRSVQPDRAETGLQRSWLLMVGFIVAVVVAWPSLVASALVADRRAESVSKLVERNAGSRRSTGRPFKRALRAQAATSADGAGGTGPRAR
jgi:hypothetical protein